MRKLIIYILVVFVCHGFISCKEMDSTYREFIVPGGKVYVGKVQNPTASNGRNRVKISWQMGTDPTISTVRVFWNNYTDSLEIDIPPGSDTVSCIIENLSERAYSFMIRSYDSGDHASMAEEVLAIVYGENYQSSLVNRTAYSSIIDTGGVTIKWGDADISSGAFVTEVEYETIEGKAAVRRISPDEFETSLEDYKPGTSFRQRTLFLPDSTSLDTFYTAFTSRKVERMIPKSGLSVFPLPTDAKDPNNPDDWAMFKAWDDEYISPGGLAESPSTPRWFTIDLGQSYQLSSYIFWQAPDRIYKSGNPRRWEVWGSNDPDTDGGWSKWTKILTCVSVKPSGGSPGTNTPEDLEAARAGETYRFPEEVAAYRYLRFKILESWEVTPWTTIAEMAFYTNDI